MNQKISIMKPYELSATLCLTAVLTLFSQAYSQEKSLSKEILPEEMQTVMHQAKYDHSLWGIYLKDLHTGDVLFDLNSDKLFSPASTTKLFSIAALLDAFGDDYRFKTPVYAAGTILQGQLKGNLILVAQGDLTMGGRELNKDTIAFTKMDHIIANEVPGVILTKQDPLYGLNELAKQVSQKGIKEVIGDVLIDDTLFETTHKREMVLSPIIINENLIDIIINPSSVGEKAILSSRPEVPGYVVKNQLTTVEQDKPLDIQINSDDLGHTIVVQGSIPIGQTNIVRTFSIKDPKSFARAAFIQALENNSVKVTIANDPGDQKTPPRAYEKLEPIALWTSPPLSEYAKLILKVSHNLGADLVPLLLASHAGQKTFDDGMRMIGDFAINKVKLSEDAFVFIDAAGGNENRLTPQAEIQLLEYLHKQKPVQFQRFFDALPILGVDGSLEDFAKKTQAAGKVRAKPGTGLSFNLATGRYFLITQALAGYIEGKNGHLFAYIIVVNNAATPTINDVFPVFEDESQLSSMLFNHSDYSK